MRTAAFFFGAYLLAALAAWATLHWPIDSSSRRAGRALVWLAAAALVVRAWSQTTPCAGVLCWDGRIWRWQTDLDDPAAAPPLVGELHVRLDLERWLLLEFIPAESPDAPKRHIWLTPGRKALPAQWHALRCAVYSPRPASLVAPDDGHPTAEPPPHEQRP
ncbi:MAG: hypothetical protein AB9M53_01390 [Leptothrix sp. (in: b-proteobacteria)]